MQISCTVTVQLICTFVFAYAQSRVSHDTAYLFIQSLVFVGTLNTIGCYAVTGTAYLEHSKYHHCWFGPKLANMIDKPIFFLLMVWFPEDSLLQNNLKNDVMMHSTQPMCSVNSMNLQFLPIFIIVNMKSIFFLTFADIILMSAFSMLYSVIMPMQ